MAKPIDTSPEILNWLASQAYGIIFAVSCGVVALLAFFGKDFWASRVVEPQVAMRDDIGELTERFTALEKKNTELEKEIISLTVVVQSLLKEQQEKHKKVDSMHDMLIELLMKKAK